ncbi:MAG: biotin--[acetyl-CoA-carboxylase] ligase [Candidatus Accumulibacter sp.]|jgi:BirA family biotin operon repressor/biotin-[acetyl-CoA-carboxylase] ligase|nr:biotin--[acetyl-CoA-carboxylase] ligase [Accumulibacter sp.]
MPDSPSLLIDPRRLHELLATAGDRFKLFAVAECVSTNTVLMQRAAGGAPSGTALVADRQSAGRGSRGRSWMSSPEASLTFSVLWRFSVGIARLSGLSLAVGVAVVAALARCGLRGVTLKWPNDVLYQDAKLGGILVELGGDGEASFAVAGIGLNLHLPEWENDAAAALPPAALDQIAAAPTDRHVLLAALLDELARVFDRFAIDGFAGLREAWNACDAWRGRPVRLLRDGRVEKEGICAGADVDGALLLHTANGPERCLSGDVSLRPR